MSKKKILILSHISEFVGGAERSILEVFDILAKDYGYEPEFIMRKPVGTLANALNERGWEYHSLPYGFWSEAKIPTDPSEVYKRSVMNAKAILEIEKIINKVKPDAVLTNSVVCPWAAIAADFARVKHIWFVREYGDLDHNREFEIGRGATLSDVGRLSELVIANSTSLADHLAHYMPKKKITTLYHPFNIEKLQQSAVGKISSPFKLQQSLKLIVVSGSITETKGQLEAIEAVGELNKNGHSAEIALLGHNGQPEFIARINDTIERYGISENVHFVGHIKNEDVLALVNLADVGITGSRKEAFGRMTFEYIAIGKPVVGTDSGATPEMVHANKNGYLYKYRDSKSLYKALLHYAQDRSLLDKHGKQSIFIAKNMLKGTHNIHALAKNVQAVLHSKRVGASAQLQYSKQWLRWVVESEQHIKQIHRNSLKKAVKSAIRSRASRNVRRAKSLARRVLNK